MVVVASRQAAWVRACRVSANYFVVALRTRAIASAMVRFLWNRWIDVLTNSMILWRLVLCWRLFQKLVYRRRVHLWFRERLLRNSRHTCLIQLRVSECSRSQELQTRVFRRLQKPLGRVRPETERCHWIRQLTVKLGCDSLLSRELVAEYQGNRVRFVRRLSDWEHWVAWLISGNENGWYRMNYIAWRGNRERRNKMIGRSGWKLSRAKLRPKNRRHMLRNKGLGAFFSQSRIASGVRQTSSTAWWRAARTCGWSRSMWPGDRRSRVWASRT